MGTLISTKYGQNTEVMMAYGELQACFKSQLEGWKINEDCTKISRFLRKNPSVEYIRKGKKAPDDGLLVREGHYYRGYIAKRKFNEFGRESWVLYIIPKK